MDSFDGIISLFIACIELLLLINVLIFTEKNAVNKVFIIIICLLFLYQFSEFLICNLGWADNKNIFFALSVITLLPPLVLLATLKFYNVGQKFRVTLFYPALFFIVYYFFFMDELQVTKCAVMYAAYYYPLGTLYGVFYYLPIASAVYLVYKNYITLPDGRKKSNSKFLLISYLITFTPSLLLYFFYPSYTEIVESILCKMALVLAVAFAFFTMKNKIGADETVSSQ